MQMKRVVAAIVWTTMIFFVGCGDSSVPKGNVNEAEKIAAQARAVAPMPDSAFKAEISVAQPPAKMQPGQKLTLPVKVRNLSNTVWPAHGRPSDGYYQVNLGNNWYESSNKRVLNNPYVRSPLRSDLAPGQETEIQLTITAPDTAGEYTLQIDLVQEMVAWFSEKGANSPKFKVQVGP